MTNPWLASAKLNPRACLRLFCFPHAGGSASIFRIWSDMLPMAVEVCPVELPGRGAQLMEPAFIRLSPLVQATAKALLPYLDKPFALFGNSLGSLISFELARQLRREYDLRPVHLFVSAHRAPQLPAPGSPTYTLSEGELLEKLRLLNGMPKELLEQPELMQLMLPIIRADFEMYDTYTYLPEPPLDCPISAFGGLQDPAVSRDQLEAWHAQTHTSFLLSMLPGGHFFMNTAQSLLLEILSHELHQIVRA